MDNLQENKAQLNKFQVLSLFLVLIGLLVSISLVQRQQQLRSKAQSAIGNAFEVEGVGVERVNENTWNTKSLDITIGVSNPDILLNP